MVNWIRNPNPANTALLPARDFLSARSLAQLEAYVAGKATITGEVATFGTEKVSAPAVRKSEIIWVQAEESTADLFNEIADKIRYANNFHYNYQLDYVGELQYSEYADDGHYGWHVDSTFGPEDKSRTRQRKLSFTIQLNDPSEYEGGAFETFYNGDFQAVDLTRNMAVFFPSYLPHQVTPVTKGVRKSLVGWVYGPLFC